ncbi:alpha/beta-hydrolase [Trametes elegans]|nr:alpha/beta-hydrolase [Trametes elegans]
MLGFVSAAALAVALPFADSQLPPTPSSWPHDYPGKPSGDFSPEWQSYFEVKDALPNVTWPLPRSFAGNIPVNRAGHPNNTLFFWALEKENGSLTAASGENGDAPWGIWLNGGPGSSSLLGFAYENGAIRLDGSGRPTPNNYSWDRAADYIWIDQPVGVGWSTTDSDGYVHDEDDTGRDFMGFLENLVKVFPSLKTRPLYLTGESYAGTYIPYIMKAYFALQDPPVNIVKFAIGDGTVGSGTVFEYLPVLSILETYPQLIAYDTEVFEWFREQEHICRFDLNLTYPQNGHFPTLHLIPPTDPARAGWADAGARESRARRTLSRLSSAKSAAKQARSVEHVRHAKRDLSLRTNGTIDSWYGCYLFDELIDYAINYTYPWNVSANSATLQGFDVYQIPDALNPESPLDGNDFFNNPQTRAALHAPTSKNWARSIVYPFLGDPVNGIDPSVEPMAFLDELAANASAKNVAVVLYAGNDDSLVAHRGIEVVIQNTTFGGIQGFSERPSTPWYDDDGQFSGVVHQERNWTYLLVEGAGHLVAYNAPERAFTLLREYILGNNQTGLVLSKENIVGGTVAALAADALPGTSGIFVGSGSTQSTIYYPAETVAAWGSYIATATATPLPARRARSPRDWSVAQ